MRTIFFTLLFYTFIVDSLFGTQLMQCKTKNQSGLDFIGKDHKEIIKFLGLENFTIKLSRSREEIIQNQITLDKLETKPSKLKNVHFSEIIIMKSNGYPMVFHCSWRFNLKLNKINQNSYECIEQKNNKDLFSLDYLGNFSLSSSFEESILKTNKKKTGTLHSIFGKCENKKKTE